jgi:hypothetical protein
MRRIVIYGHDSQAEKFIDVSLKHFLGDDIRKRMREIHQEWGLSLPM